MVCSVLYVVDSYAPVAGICNELASVILMNKASGFTIALGVFSYSAPDVQLLVSRSKLTVALVTQIRKSAQAYKEKFEDPKHFSSNKKFSAFAAPRVEAMAHDYDIVIFRSGESLSYSSNPSIPLDGIGIDGDAAPRREVKPVRTFSGMFTVGDPRKPLVEVPIALYPATRHATTTEVVVLSANERVVRTSELHTESGAPVNMARLQKAYPYLNEMVMVDNDLQQLMDGEFEGAEEWPQAFELLATIPEVEPWLPNDRTDYIVGTDQRAVSFLRSFASTLLSMKMHALIRVCTEPRYVRSAGQGGGNSAYSGKGSNGDAPSRERRKKGKVTLMVLHPSSEDHLFVSPLPFKEDYKSFYRFAEIPHERPEDPTLASLDDTMDSLVDGMTVDEEPTLIPNYMIERTALFLKAKIASGKQFIPPMPDLDGPLFTSTSSTSATSPECTAANEALSEELVRGFGIHEVNPFDATNARAAAAAASSGSDPSGHDARGIDFEFI